MEIILVLTVFEHIETMAFGKKKSLLRSEASRKARASISEASAHHPDQTPDLDAMKSITVIEAGRLAAGLCEARGYPTDFLPNAASFIMWLESRGMPALSNMSTNLFEHWNKDLRERGPHTDTHGVPTFPCPLFASALTKGMIDQLINAGPTQKITFICEGPVFLLLPRLADHAAQNKIALQIEIHPTDRYADDPTSFILHENEFAAHGGTTSLSGPANILIRFFPQDYLPPKTAFSSHTPKLKTINVQAVLLELISEYRQNAGYTGPLPFKNRLAGTSLPQQPMGLSPLSPTTRNFFSRIIDTNYELTQTFAALSKGEASNFHLIVFGDSEGQDYSKTHLVTSQNSPIAAFYRHCKELGWMIPVADALLDQYNMMTLQVTKTGRMGLSVLFTR